MGSRYGMRSRYDNYGSRGNMGYRDEEEEWEDSLPNEEDVNYVVIQDNGEPLKWSDDNKVVIYGGIEDAENDVIEGDKIVEYWIKDDTNEFLYKTEIDSWT